MRLLLALALPLSLVLLAVLAAGMILLGRPDRRDEVARAVSRVLSACTTGDGDRTFSADSYVRLITGRWDGRIRVRIVDLVTGSRGHCRRAWEWHRARGLV